MFIKLIFIVNFIFFTQDRYIIVTLLALAFICIWHGVQTRLPDGYDDRDYIALVVFVGLYIVYNLQFFLRIYSVVSINKGTSLNFISFINMLLIFCFRVDRYDRAEMFAFSCIYASLLIMLRLIKTQTSSLREVVSEFVFYVIYI